MNATPAATLTAAVVSARTELQAAWTAFDAGTGTMSDVRHAAALLRIALSAEAILLV